MLPDDGEHVAYPDACQGRDGTIYVIYENAGQSKRSIHIARITEAAIRAGRIAGDSCLQVTANMACSTRTGIDSFLADSFLAPGRVHVGSGIGNAVSPRKNALAQASRSQLEPCSVTETPSVHSSAGRFNDRIDEIAWRELAGSDCDFEGDW